ncbi:hypothetical protein HG531_010387 [Fusarium graminearum]|nr:hypothetical protein HG531_010387 [Fusarium graminearum]
MARRIVTRSEKGVKVKWWRWPSSCSVADDPSLLLLWFLFDSTGGGGTGKHEAVRISVRFVVVGYATLRGLHTGTPRWSRGGTRMLLNEMGLAVLLLKVAATPDAGTDPDGGDADNENDNHDDPLPMV